jgi:myo-inositol 2-dehydrogenase/D-chiro-inositol 1-dehydrogenase/scyllo-inositol 2-dehydrogenase (NAD+)
MAAEHKKHVFLEKPMALSLQECDAILSVVEQNSVLLQLGFMRRFDPEFVAAAERIQAGEIGQPMMIKSNTHGPGLPPPWARDLRTSNGMLAEVNSHDWDTTRWLMGSDYERVYTEVANFKGAANHVDAPHFYDNVLVTIKFESGGLGMISGVCPCGYGYDARAEIIGDKGIMQIGELRGQSVGPHRPRPGHYPDSEPGPSALNGPTSMNSSILSPASRMIPLRAREALRGAGRLPGFWPEQSRSWKSARST